MPNRVITEVYCPHCARRIEIKAACGADRLLTAISLQAERFGAELFCHHCDTGFIYKRLRTHQASTTLTGPHRVPSLAGRAGQPVSQSFRAAHPTED